MSIQDRARELRPLIEKAVISLSDTDALEAVELFPHWDETKEYEVDDRVSYKTNLYKCFLPQAWYFGSETGVSAFVHPDGIFDDPKGGLLRKKL